MFLSTVITAFDPPAVFRGFTHTWLRLLFVSTTYYFWSSGEHTVWLSSIHSSVYLCPAMFFLFFSASRLISRSLSTLSVEHDGPSQSNPSDGALRMIIIMKLLETRQSANSLPGADEPQSAYLALKSAHGGALGGGCFNNSLFCFAVVLFFIIVTGIWSRRCVFNRHLCKPLNTIVGGKGGVQTKQQEQVVLTASLPSCSDRCFPVNCSSFRGGGRGGALHWDNVFRPTPLGVREDLNGAKNIKKCLVFYRFSFFTWQFSTAANIFPG